MPMIHCEYLSIYPSIYLFIYDCTAVCANEAQLENCLHPIDYRDLLEDVEDYTAGQPDFIANAGNVSSLIWHAFMKANRPINWAGFYYVRPLSNPKEADHSHILILGPFMGKPACTRIRFQDGVCGAAASTKQVQRIADVHQFKGHIACDGASKSELVVPIFNEKNEVVAVIDIDSPREEGFTVEDERRIQDIATHLSTASQWLNMNLPFTQN
jgi:putative methionine-R-sulfoxide reductase with GAF domain